MTGALRYVLRTDPGLVRGNNEDSAYAGPRLLVVADGMGGYAGGEIASSIAVAALAPLDDVDADGDLISALRSAADVANEEIAALVAGDEKLTGMGTTLTALLFNGNRVGLLHIGDSRAYLLRGRILMQITRDDTFVQRLVDEGRITAEEARTHPQRSLIVRALNGSSLEPDLSVREVRSGDRYLLCSDGLSDMVPPETLLEALREEDPRDAADRLVELALRAGGPDNVTCLVADVVDAGHGDDSPVVQIATEDRSAPAPAPAGARTRTHRVVLAAVAAVLVLGISGLWWWTQTQYFVGRAGEQVAVYRGVNASLGPVRLFSVAERSEILISDLQGTVQQEVEAGIPARSRSDAERILDNIAGHGR
jgi:serine/threonine protein phosphatase PrpC